MPLENLKRLLHLKEEAEKAEIRRRNEKNAQQFQLKELQRKEEDRQEKEKIKLFKECYSSCHINDLIIEMHNLTPNMEIANMEKNTKDPSFYYISRNKRRGVGLEVGWIFGNKLVWDKYRNKYLISWFEIDIGFLEDKTLVVVGDEDEGFTSIPECQWRKNPTLIEDAVEKGYLHPKRELIQNPDDTSFYPPGSKFSVYPIYKNN